MKLVVTPRKGIRRGDRFDVAGGLQRRSRQVFIDPDDAIEGWVPACYTPAGAPQVCDSFFVVGEPIGSQAWFPSNNHPSDKAKLDHRDHRARGRHRVRGR